MGLAQSSVGFPDVGKSKTAVANIFPIIDRKRWEEENGAAGR